MEYKPNPVDLSDIDLSEDIKNDVERISMNIHETWAQQRIERGWSYGSVYDSNTKKNPCLIEYDALPEKEKDMDRATVLQTIKMLLRLGYKIEKEK